MIDYYKILGLERSAGADDIKKAYRKKAMEFHPDTNRDNPDAEEQFKNVSEAYEVLKDPEKKSNYVMFGDADGRPNMGGASSHGFGGGAHSPGGVHMNDIINEFMKSHGTNINSGYDFGMRQPQKNADLISELAITLESAYSGTTTTIDMTNADGTVNTINVTIPPGSKHGLTLRLKEKGHRQNTDLPPGDLHLKLNVIPHKTFAVIGMDMVMEKNISMVDAAIGCDIEVPLLDGKTIKVAIPEGSQPNQKIRLKGKGMPGLNNINVHGDLYIKINVKIPTSLTDEQKDILRNLQYNLDRNTLL